MPAINVDEEYKEERILTYKEETYSIRDNGAVLRHPKSTINRKYDNFWTFGKPDKAGYMSIASVRIHVLVAKAFLPKPERTDFVIDHIDTNRQNNRATNLHWVSRLDNALKNPITAAKIEAITGMSIEEVMERPEVLHNIPLPPNISWMGTVSESEFKRSFDSWSKWAKAKDSHHSFPMKGDPRTDRPRVAGLNLKTSRTQGVFLEEWQPDGCFPLCPGPGHTLEDYRDNIHVQDVFYYNDYGYSIKVVAPAEISKDRKSLVVKCTETNRNAVKPFYVVTIRQIEGWFAHSRKSHFMEDGQDKYFTLGLGKEWSGGNVFDDYC